MEDAKPKPIQFVKLVKDMESSIPNDGGGYVLGLNAILNWSEELRTYTLID